jgi:hypothetical protein
MMMTQISSNATQAKLNMERLKAVRERIQQTNISPNTSTPEVFSQNLQETQQVSNEASSRSISPSGRIEAPQAPEASALLSPELRQQDYSRFQNQAQSQEAFIESPSPTQPLKNRSLPPAPPLPQGRFGLPVGDIQSIAEKAGFVGVDQSAIERAYATRKSLFVDIKI